MKKILFAAAAVAMMAAGCNVPPTPSPFGATSTNTASPEVGHSTATQTYNGKGFNFQYPADWKVSDAKSPKNQAGVCGDAFNDADYCAFFTSPEGKEYNAFFVVYKTTKTLNEWCNNSIFTWADCTVQNFNGYQSITTTTPLSDSPILRARIFGYKGTVVEIVGDEKYADSVNLMGNTINFAK